MREIECICLDQGSKLQDSYFKKMSKEVGVEIILRNWDDLKINTHSPLIVMLDFEHLEMFKNLMNNRDEKLIVALNSRKDFKIVSELKDYFDKVFGFIDLSQEVEYNIPLLKNYLNMNFSRSAIGLEKLARDLDKVYEFTKSELVKVKDLHDRFVKVRVDQLKGAKITSKFMAGEKSGGEFFEIIQNDNEILFFQAGSDSYLLSSLILAEIETLKESYGTTNLHKKAEVCIKNILRYAAEHSGALSYCLMSLDLKTLEASFTLKGEGHLFYQNKLIHLNRSMILKLKPKERLILISEGAIRNMELLTKFSCEKFLIENQQKSVNDLINEYFFEISRNKPGQFLIFDAFLAILEIEENMKYRLL
ncbi:MAG: hypothetical protein KBD76_06120 [Bacteriovorax sp.]|jgi:hypothetical protein|nr:hypothetical protein [Bacteriovorax sp.]